MTKVEIERDIQAFRDRIAEAEEKLSRLPKAASDWKGRKKLKAKRRELQGKIVHVESLMKIAVESIKELSVRET
jgi:predicted  nucleic acid-binding Zn-ribbon protein